LTIFQNRPPLSLLSPNNLEKSESHQDDGGGGGGGGCGDGGGVSSFTVPEPPEQNSSLKSPSPPVQSATDLKETFAAKSAEEDAGAQEASSGGDCVVPDNGSRTGVRSAEEKQQQLARSAKVCGMLLEAHLLTFLRWREIGRLHAVAATACSLCEDHAVAPGLWMAACRR
jgi:hypothetical protein